MKKIVLITLCLIGLIGFAQAATSGSPAQTVSNSEASANPDHPHLTLIIWQEGDYTGAQVWTSHPGSGGTVYVHNGGNGVYPLELLSTLSEVLYLPTSEVQALSIEKLILPDGRDYPFTWEYQFN